ncbi:MAG: Rieske 2Fe-2S domain-containing protein [Acidobacteriota bacterium]|jgi:Rieske Fe-S protein
MQDRSKLSRRQVLAYLGRACGGAAVLGVGRCAPQAPALPATLILPLSELPDGVRVRRMVGRDPVEILRDGDEVRARSLLCSHTGCVVDWVPAEREYVCPCHDGRYGPDGRVLAGPPPSPLTDLKVTIEGDRVTIHPRSG